ncbi:MAG: winged helix-turn-helix transcriptional regulator [Clostridia bacterium]|nr:winged helix-turn-helix transcriptional regulator [Clostridia bacterium]
MSLQNTLKALADPTRREILGMLKKSRLSAGEIAAQFTMSAPAVSKHLNILKEADMVRDCREGKFIYYELNASVLEEVMLWIAELKGEAHEERIPDTVFSDYGDPSDDLHTAGSVT